MAVHKLHPAFLRPLKFLIDVPLPARAERVELWRRALPPKCPTDVQPAQLADLGARFRLSGGAIRRAAYRAAATAALRVGSARLVRFADLEQAAEVEKTKNDGDVTRAYASQFL